MRSGLGRHAARLVAAGLTPLLLAGPLAGMASAAKPTKVATPSITSRPASSTNATSATFAFSDTQTGVSFQCALDGAAYVACTSPKTYTGLAAAAHAFKVRARTATGALSSAATASWTVDRTPPVTPTIVAHPANPTRTTTGTVQFATSDTGVTFRCTLDAGAEQACTSPFTTPVLAEGSHTVGVLAVDSASNRSPAATTSWVVDTTPPPAPLVSSGPATLTNSTDATFAFRDDDRAATLRCSLDGAAAASCTTPWHIAGPLTQGAHTFVVSAADAAGNVAAGASYGWTVDSTAPPTPVLDAQSVPGDPTTAASASFAVTDADPTAVLMCSVDAAPAAACTSPVGTGPLADGRHVFAVYGHDAATNDSGVVRYSWTIDSTPPPVPTVNQAPAARSATTDATFGFSDPETDLSFRCTVDGADAPCTSPVSYAGPLADGAHHFGVTAFDAVGNATASAPVTWTVDTVAPHVSVSPASTLTGAVRATFTESVANVVPADIALRVSGTTTNLATTLTCRDTAGTTVSCATGAVRAVTLQPRSALISGQRYATVFDQSTPRVTDLAGNVLVAPAATPTFRASLSEQESSAGATQLWRLVTTTAASGGSYLAERASGAALRYPFSGTSITWYTATGPTQGLAYVYVDGTRRASVNNYASTAHWKVARTVTGLAAGAHRLTIVVRGLRGSTAGKDTLVVVDAFRVGTTTTSTPYVTPLWSRVTSGSASAGAFVRSNLAASAVRFTFRGTAVSWYTVTGRDQGKAEIWVDGVRKATVDNYATATAYGVRRFVGSLTDQVHVVKVVVLGTHRTGATNSWVAVDRFGVA